MDNASLTVDRVEVAYGPVRVLNGVSLEVAAGEFVALLGSSGCGKTTLLRAISGFVPVRAGAILVAGRDITRLSPERRNMAMVFQSYALWPHMTMAQNLAYGLRLRRVPRAARARRVQEITALLGLEGLADRPVTQLSGGQRQRVALGRALAINPKILLLDEPLSNLDARIRTTMRHEIKAIQQQVGITAIHVTHDREEAMVMADRIAIMNAGADRPDRPAGGGLQPPRHALRRRLHGRRQRDRRRGRAPAMARCGSPPGRTTTPCACPAAAIPARTAFTSPAP